LQLRRRKALLGQDEGYLASGGLVLQDRRSRTVLSMVQPPLVGSDRRRKLFPKEAGYHSKSISTFFCGEMQDLIKSRIFYGDSWLSREISPSVDSILLLQE